MDASPESNKIQFMAIGDWGSRTGTQIGVGKQMADRSASTDFVVALGDNFYFSGVSSLDDPLWDNVFSKTFAGVTCPWYPILGNHDWEGNPQAQIDYSEFDAKWNMEALYYTKEFGDGLLQVFFIDTTMMCPTVSRSLTGKSIPTVDREAQYDWLETALRSSTSKWKIVCGHYPVYSNGENGSTIELQRLERLMQAFKVDVYLCGHDHSMQHHFNVSSNIHHFVTGSGSSTRYFRQHGSSKHTVWQSLTGGFTTVLVELNDITVEYISEKGKSVYCYKISKAGGITVSIRPASTRVVDLDVKAQAVFDNSTDPLAAFVDMKHQGASDEDLRLAMNLVGLTEEVISAFLVSFENPEATAPSAAAVAPGH